MNNTGIRIQTIIVCLTHTLNCMLQLIDHQNGHSYNISLASVSQHFTRYILLLAPVVVGLLSFVIITVLLISLLVYIVVNETL